MTGGLDTRPNATTFVLDDLVNQAWVGQIRVPHFQRGLRWDRQDVLRLFDSILKGYPIGNLLLWVRSSPEQKVTLGQLAIDAPAAQETLWVVDGQQRITSLANALHEDGATDPRFALAYDLDRKQVVPRPNHTDPRVIPLPMIFDLQRLVQWQVENPEMRDSIDDAAAVTKRLREFTIPTYLVRQDDPEVLQDIFDRMNNYGKKLTRAEVFSALYAGQENSHEPGIDIRLIADEISADLKFGLIDDDTIMRALLARRGPDVEREIRLEFNAQDRKGSIDFPDEDRDTAFDLGREAIRRAVRFLRDQAGVPHVSMLPYRYLLIVLTRYFSHDVEPDARNLQLLRRWFWRSAIGGPYVVKGSTTATTRTLNGLIRPARIKDAIPDLLSAVSEDAVRIPALSSFRTNTAATKILLASWWDLSPRSVRTGEPYSQPDLAAALADSSTAFDIVTLVTPQRNLPEKYRTWAANRLLLVDQDDRFEYFEELVTGTTYRMDEHTREAVLESHCFDAETVRLLSDQNTENFVVARQKLIAQQYANFIRRMCEWDFEDTPSFNDLLFDQEESETDTDDADS